MQRRMCLSAILALSAGAIPAAGQPSPNHALSGVAPGDLASATKEAFRALPQQPKTSSW